VESSAVAGGDADDGALGLAKLRQQSEGDLVMKIGFDVSQTGALRAGCGFFAYSLIRAFADSAMPAAFLLYPTFGDFFFDPDWYRSTYLPERPNFARGRSHSDHRELLAFWGSPPPDFEAQLGYPDIVHSNNFYCPRHLEKARLIYTLYDLSFLENPQWTIEANRTGCFEGVFQASLHADRILAISHFSKRHFLEVFPHYPEERVSVVHLASRFNNTQRVQRPRNLGRLQPGQFWLCVGTLEPRKNHARLLHAYAKLKARLGRVLPLVLAGGKGWLMDHLNRLIDDLGLVEDVIITGYIKDEAMQWLYQNCYAALYPSLFEGFGLPVLEAMSLGAAVVTSNVTSIPEITGDAAILVDPLADQEIFEAMLRLAQDSGLRQHLQQRAVQQARRFRWDQAAQTTLECYQQALLQPRLKDLVAQRQRPVRTASERLMEQAV
jgi:glycosyltransferase involved in cell wall biosynthesis